MKGHRAVAGSLAILGLWSCLIAGPKVKIDNLLQHWVRSYEEEKPGQTVQIFRPSSWRTFPPSRFRMAYTFAGDGSCELYVLSPDDAHHFDRCTWSVAESDKAWLEIKHAGATARFKIVELSGGLLRLEPVE
jgi:hypothetical protein